MSEAQLENDWLRLRIAIEHGASPIEFSLRSIHVPACPPSAPDFLPILRPTSAEVRRAGDSARFGSYTLCPYSNRIRDGRMRFLGREFSLSPNWPDGQVIHGDVRMRRFVVEQPDSQTLCCRYESRHESTPNFPFHFALKKTYRLEGTALHIELALTNTDSQPMPAGLGIHPYFVRTLWPKAADPRLCFFARGEYAVDAQVIPTGPPRPLSADHDFAQPRPVYAQPIDCVFSGWDGEATLTWPGTGVTLALRADPLFGHFVVYNGDPDGTLALEPVSHATDACNLAERGVPGTGLQVLAPAASLHGRITLALHLDGVRS